MNEHYVHTSAQGESGTLYRVISVHTAAGGGSGTGGGSFTALLIVKLVSTDGTQNLTYRTSLHAVSTGAGEYKIIKDEETMSCD